MHKNKAFILMFLSSLCFCVNSSFATNTFNDVSRLNPTTVSKIIHVSTTEDISKALQEASLMNLKISIAGKRHSQGGQQSYPGGIVLDMLGFNKILALDTIHKTIRVEPGATWEDIQNYVQPYGLAVKVMQASNIFTVGGSLGPNIHGNDPNYGTIIDTVISFHLICDDGRIIKVSRQENPELFSLAIGGYGLFGVMTDIEFSLTDDVIYAMRSQVMDYKEYSQFFHTQILNHPQIGLHSAKLSNAPDSLLKEIVVTNYVRTDKKEESLFKLQQEKNIERNKIFFGLSRTFDWGKNLRWYLQKKIIAKVGQTDFISRNNAMRPIIKFLEYHYSKDTDILQEYFVPMDKFVSFVDGLREIVKNEKVNLLSVTVRFVPQDKTAFMPYAKTDCFALVLYINQKLDSSGIETAKLWTRQMVDLALDLRGSYYLPYQLYPSREELLKAYPEFDEFIQKKKIYDPQEIFMNQFYEHYRKKEHEIHSSPIH